MPKLYLLVVIHLFSLHTFAQSFKPSDLIGSWKAENKGISGTMRFNNDGQIIGEYLDNKVFASYIIDSGNHQNVIQMHSHDKDSLNTVYMKIEKINQDEINLTFTKVIIFNDSTHTFNEDMTHTGMIIYLKRKNN
jgi:hypothetical protein